MNVAEDDDRHARQHLIFEVVDPHRFGRDAVIGQHRAGREADRDRHEADRRVEEAGHDGARYRDLLVAARQRTLDQVLPDHAAEPHDDPAADVVDVIRKDERHRLAGGGVERMPHADRQIRRAEPAGHLGPAPGLEHRPRDDDEQPDDDQRNLHHVGQRHGPHAAGEGVDQHDRRADESPP